MVENKRAVKQRQAVVAARHDGPVHMNTGRIRIVKTQGQEGRLHMRNRIARIELNRPLIIVLGPFHVAAKLINVSAVGIYKTHLRLQGGGLVQILKGQFVIPHPRQDKAAVGISQHGIRVNFQQPIKVEHGIRVPLLLGVIERPLV